MNFPIEGGAGKDAHKKTSITGILTIAAKLSTAKTQKVTNRAEVGTNPPREPADGDPQDGVGSAESGAELTGPEVSQAA